VGTPTSSAQRGRAFLWNHYCFKKQVRRRRKNTGFAWKTESKKCILINGGKNKTCGPILDGGITRRFLRSGIERQETKKNLQYQEGPAIPAWEKGGGMLRILYRVDGNLKHIFYARKSQTEGNEGFTGVVPLEEMSLSPNRVKENYYKGKNEEGRVRNTAVKRRKNVNVSTRAIQCVSGSGKKQERKQSLSANSVERDTFSEKPSQTPISLKDPQRLPRRTPAPSFPASQKSCGGR